MQTDSTAYATIPAKSAVCESLLNELLRPCGEIGERTRLNCFPPIITPFKPFISHSNIRRTVCID